MLYTNSSESHHAGKRELLLEIELNGKIALEHLLNTIYGTFGITYRIISAEVEYFSGQNFGNVRLLIQSEKEQHRDLEYYLNRSKVLNTFIEYRSRKVV